MLSTEYHPKSPAKLPTDSNFYPGKNLMIRMEEFYQNTLIDDVMILTYRDAETEKKFVEKRKKRYLPQTKNAKDPRKPTPLRQRGNKQIQPTPLPQSHLTIPKLQAINLNCMMKQAIINKQHLLSGLMALQSITSEQPSVIYARSDVSTWKLREGMPIGCKVSIKGASMYTFLDKLVEIVLPRMKDWDGIQFTSGDGDGNIAMGLPSSALGLFPDIEGNYEMYPTITGFNVIFQTTAYTDVEGRLLLSGLQLPFSKKKK
nr:8623_t:CDS:2 [Entrophospora candida]CAG8674790.1 5993_t:CDS:2 [Entrophospora candida]